MSQTYVKCVPRYAPRDKVFKPAATTSLCGSSARQLAELLSVSEWIIVGWDWMPADLSVGARMRRRAAMNQGSHEHHGRMALIEDAAGDGGRWDLARRAFEPCDPAHSGAYPEKIQTWKEMNRL